MAQLKHTVIRNGFISRPQTTTEGNVRKFGSSLHDREPEQGRIADAGADDGRLRDGMAVAAEDAAPSIPLNDPTLIAKTDQDQESFHRAQKRAPLRRCLFALLWNKMPLLSNVASCGCIFI